VNVVGILSIIGIVLATLAVLVVGGLLLVKNFYKKVDQGRALLINKTGKEPEVSFTGGLVLPVIHKAETMDISLKTIELHRRGKDGLICQDKVRADIQVTFYVRVNKTEEDVRKVATSIGCNRASDQETLEQLFLAKFSEALKTVGYQLRFEDLYKERDQFKEAILREIGEDLNGYVLDAAAIDYLEQTPLEALDPENILDAEGIRSITELTAAKNVETNLLRNNEKKRMTKDNVETREAVLALERQQAAAEAAQAREVANVRAREKAETERVGAEELKKAKEAQIKAEEEIRVAEENKNRQVEVANLNRQRVVAVESERVERERLLEVIARERDVDLNRIEKDKAVEKEKKEIADVVRSRVAVEKTVAEEEERIKDLRANMTAKRQADVKVITAEAEAQEALVKDIKAAEASEKAAAFKAKERVLLADADLEAADRDAKAKIRRADGIKAEEAASGLAAVQVKEADAAATEKMGLVEAKVLREKEAAEAKGIEDKGLAEVKVRDADAAVVQKLGASEASMIRDKGAAEAEAVEAKMIAEARGLQQKTEAMKALQGAAKEHEEFRIKLEVEKEVRLEALNVQKDVALAQAEILGKAFGNAKIDIVGGDGQFFDRFVNAVGVGKSIDGAIGRSDALKAVAGDYLDGSKSLPGDVKDILANPKFSSGDISNLTLSALMGKLMTDASPDQASKLKELMDKASELGIDDLLKK
jgi:uncharacterized membrane protein YqiK